MIPQVSQIQEIMAIPQEYFWLPWAVQYFFHWYCLQCNTLCMLAVLERSFR